MKGLCFILFFGASQAEQTQFQSGLSAVHQVVSEMPASARQVAISKLLETVEREPTLSEDSIEILTNVSCFLTALIPTLLSDAVFDQSLMNQYEAVYEECTNNFAGADSTHSDTVSAAKSAHDSCRDTENGTLQTAHTKCKAANEKAAIHHGNTHLCPDPQDQTMTNAQEYLDYYSTGNSYFANSDVQFETLQTECADAVDAWATQHYLCNSKQVTFERAMCQWYAFRIMYCNPGATNLQQCYTDAETQLNQTKAAVAEKENGRREMIIAIRKVECLINKILNEEAIAADSCPITLNADEESKLTMVYPAVPHPAECHSEVDSEVNPNPGSAGWATHANSGYADSAPGPCEVDVCHAPPETCR